MKCSFQNFLAKLNLRRLPVTLLCLAAMAAYTVAPLRADDGMGGYDSGGYGGYDGGDYGGGVDVGGIIDGIIGAVGGYDDPGYYDPGYDPGPQYYPEPQYYPQPQYYPPQYSPPAYTPPQVVTPPRNSAPPFVKQPTPTQQSPKPPKNHVNIVTKDDLNPPKNKPAVEKFPLTIVQPVGNQPSGLRPAPLDQAAIDKLTNDTQKATDKLKDDANKNRPSKDLVDKAVAATGDKLSPKEKEDLTKAINDGKPDDVKKILEGKGVDPAVAKATESLAGVNQAINNITNPPGGGQPSPADLANAQQAINNLNQQVSALNQQVAGLQQQLAGLQQQLAGLNQNLQNLQNQINQQIQAIQQQTQAINNLINAVNRQNAQLANLTRAINQLARNQILLALLGRLQPGLARIPRGPGVVIVQAPGRLPPGRVAPLGPGAVMMGAPVGGGAPQGPYMGPTSITVGDVWKTAGLGMTSAQPLGDSSADLLRGVVLYNFNDTAVGFVADDKDTYNLQAQHYQTFPTGKQGVISFDRGTGENARYTVREGSYEFTATEKGWELFRKTFKATIDNTAQANDFSFVLGQETVTVPAGQSKEISSPYALGVKFDDGRGNVHEKRILGGTYRVATSQASGALDLFDAKQATDVASTEPGSIEDVSDPELKELLAGMSGALGQGSVGSVGALAAADSDAIQPAGGEGDLTAIVPPGAGG